MRTRLIVLTIALLALTLTSGQAHSQGDILPGVMMPEIEVHPTTDSKVSYGQEMVVTARTSFWYAREFRVLFVVDRGASRASLFTVAGQLEKAGWPRNVVWQFGAINAEDRMAGMLSCDWTTDALKMADCLPRVTKSHSTADAIEAGEWAVRQHLGNQKPEEYDGLNVVILIDDIPHNPAPPEIDYAMWRYGCRGNKVAWQNQQHCAGLGVQVIPRTLMALACVEDCDPIESIPLHSGERMMWSVDEVGVELPRLAMQTPWGGRGTEGTTADVHMAVASVDGVMNTTWSSHHPGTSGYCGFPFPNIFSCGTNEVQVKIAPVPCNDCREKGKHDLALAMFGLMEGEEEVHVYSRVQVTIKPPVSQLYLPAVVRNGSLGWCSDTEYCSIIDGNCVCGGR